ncbi:family 43 glycosylhydrolase [uncultured Pseudoflavonifractor sp.]|uniref:family 43 glycosylhydrolase n=1 Tax=uncultured Pseudoflavonifractor sp. TaxID=1221379 RepID=UPI0025CCC92F|nr:family 43 glycosylhydrolase [uncultured Pseudoflavonifractor sp.]
MEQAFNPYLPGWEYVPDGEPHVFGDRVYVYGSHDRFGGPLFCMNDYVCWSAPVSNLKDWRYEGVIYRKDQDPMNRGGRRCLYAPDVTRGPDGRYYLYYAFDFLGVMAVAVCDTPAGAYQFRGHVKFQDGHIWGTRSGEPFPFDPGVLTDDDGRVWLYSGFATKVPAVASGFHSLTNPGGVVLELEPDMVTIKAGPDLLFPARGKPGAFAGHAFFEASSIRKVDGQYCFVYSSEHNHELCYAMGPGPRGPFSFGGTLVDIGDLFLDGREDERRAVNYLGNTHGGIVDIGGQWYVFYHRQTNRHSYSRQACAEPLERRADGGFCQAEVTSCGLNGGPLKGSGQYPARIACNLWSGKGTARYDIRFPRFRLSAHPYFTQEGKDGEERDSQYIANMRDGAVAGFKYFAFASLKSLSVQVRGSANGALLVSDTPDFEAPAARIEIKLSGEDWEELDAPCAISDGTRPLYFKFTGKGRLDFRSFTLTGGAL